MDDPLLLYEMASSMQHDLVRTVRVRSHRAEDATLYCKTASSMHRDLTRTIHARSH